jgi:hypothetical protein
MGYPFWMSRYEKQVEAEKRYDAKRAKKPIGCRLDEKTLARVDKKLRGGSRSALVEQLILEWLNRA